jgi:hypothetical protein
VETVVAGEILLAVQERLASYGLTFTHERLGYTGDPGMWKGTMQFGDSHAMVRVVLAAPMTLTALARVGIDDQQLHSPHLRTFVVGRHVHERSADAFRDMGIAYADTVGNAYIRFGSVVLDVRGRRPSNPERRSERFDPDAPGPHSSNLFSTGRAQVIATLLTWPRLAMKPVREIARVAGVSTGQAYSALTLLEQTGYLADRRLRADRIDELVDLWTAAYPRGLGQKLAVASYASAGGIHDFRQEILSGTSDGVNIDVFALSGESVPGLGLKRPRSVTVYTRDWTPRQAIRHRWRAASTTAEADIHVRRQFWTPHTDGKDSAANDPVAPWPIVYADLMAAGDERLAAVATEWRNRHRTA